MKHIIPAALSMVLLLTACGQGTVPTTPTPAPANTPAPVTETTAPVSIESQPAESVAPMESTTGSDTLVVYFSRVGNTDFPDDVDAVSFATLNSVDGELKGNAQLMAEWMADEAGADLFEMQTVDKYPVDYRETTDVAKAEQNANARPELATHIEGFENYSAVYLVIPNWWGDLPMAVYSFFDQYDFSGKTIYVSITHEGSSFSRTVDTIRGLEPDATVIQGIDLRGGSVADSEQTVRQFIQENH